MCARPLQILTLVADWVFAYYVQWDLRPFRFLRPLVFISYVRELRRWMYLSVRMLPKLFEMVRAHAAAPSSTTPACW